MGKPTTFITLIGGVSVLISLALSCRTMDEAECAECIAVDLVHCALFGWLDLRFCVACDIFDKCDGDETTRRRRS